MKKSIVSYFLILILFVYLNAYMHLNNTDECFSETEKGEISNLLIEGAAEYISSYSEALLLLREYELYGLGSFSISNALLKTESALEKLEKSRKKYSDALSIGEKAGYKSICLNKLIYYNYDKYIDDFKLNKLIADEVKYYLSRGDVIGLYKKNIEKIDEIIEILKDIHSTLSSNTIPEISVFWKLLQKYTEHILFGNYSTILSRNAYGIN